MRRFGSVACTLVVLVASAACSRSPEEIHVGAVYPLSGSQGPGGRDEFRGVSLAVDLVNADGGVRGARIALDPIDVAGADEAPAAVDALADRGVDVVLGSYGSTISQPAAAEAVRRGLLFWETGAVGSMAPAPGGLFFRVAPSGRVTLGAAAVAFEARRLAPMLGRTAGSLRFAVANVDDVYGSSVADGAVREIRVLGLPFVGRFPYDVHHLDAAGVIRRVAAAKPDVLFVSAYVHDGIALRREMIRQRLHLVSNIGTSSSYCMPAFGLTLGRDAVGLYASDKLDGEYVNPAGLTSAGRALLDRARNEYEAAFHTDMSAAALAGFSAAWALFHTVMPAATELTPGGVATAARAARIPMGGLPNGSGLAFAGPGTSDPGANVRAMSVIWEWVRPGVRAVVWPPRFATSPVEPIRIVP